MSGPSGAVADDADAELSLLTRRLRLFAKALAVVVVTTYPIGFLELRTSYGLSWTEIASHPIHIQPVLALYVVLLWRWLEAQPRSRRALEVVDAILTIGFSMAWITLVSYIIHRYPEKATSDQVDTGSATIVVTLLVVGRAALIPSRPGRTAILSALAFVPVAGLAYARATIPAWSAPQPPLFRISPELVTGVVVAALSSGVIHDLRREVRASRRLGAYEVGQRLGEGASGIVYHARHALLRRDTAIKILRPEKSNVTTIHRFEREVRVASRLTHPNTLAVYDYGRTQDGLLYYAMELCSGIDLERLVRASGPLPPARVASLVSQVCGALAEAHEAGLVHRDIKPANILIGPRGGSFDVVKVADFGLARDMRPACDDVAVTDARTVLGTPAYLPPEAIDAPGKVDARSDLYGVGAVAYYLLTGTRVFSAESLVGLILCHLSASPESPSTRLGHPVPAVLEEVILQCLAKDPAARPTSAREIAKRLEGLAATWSQSTRQPRGELERISARRRPPSRRAPVATRRRAS